jgi:uncharacterized repeat protein (TIGR02543 family)
VTTVGSYAFSQCTNLTSVMIPKSVTSIRDYAFEQTSLQDVYYAGRANDWAAINIETYNLVLTNARIHYLGETPASRRSSAVFVSSHTYSGGSSDSSKKTVKFVGGIYSNEWVSAANASNDSDEHNKPYPEIDINWSFRLFDGNASVPNVDLTIAALVLSANAYDKETIVKTLGEDGLGFENILPENYDGYNDDPDKVAYVLASKVYNHQNIIAIVCRGSATGEDWESNLLNPFGGFLEATDNLLFGGDGNIGLNRYIEDCGLDTSLPTKFFITGHSRGGAVANILGTTQSDYINTNSERIFVYTFACPNTTEAAGRRSYTNIHNIELAGDPVPFVPPMWGGSNKFGTIHRFNSKDFKYFDASFWSLTGVSPLALDAWFVDCYSDYPMVARHHAPAAYMACLLGDKDVYQHRAQMRYKVIPICCPVDVAVYDRSNHLLGAITNNVPDGSLAANGIYVVVDGDEKYIYASSEVELRLELTGTDTGTMSYSVREVDADTGEVLEEREFTDVALTDGKTMVSAIAEDIAAEDTQLFVRENGKITAEIDTAGNETEVVILSFDVGLGDPVRDVAVPWGASAGTLPFTQRPGYVFEGWYADEELTEPFDTTAALEESVTLYARFTPRFEVYGYFSAVTYDGEAMAATVAYDYNSRTSLLYVALYQEGKLIALGSASALAGAAAVTVDMPVSDLCGIYELRAFSLDAAGTFLPLCDCAEVSFISN